MEEDRVMAMVNRPGLAERALAAVERQAWLDTLSERLQQGLAATFRAAGPAGQKIKNALHGTWLGHPLHPVLTDVPLGAWTTALVLDSLDARENGRWNRRGGFGQGADSAITIGLVGAAGAAITGLTDWQHTAGAPRKAGLVHGLLNTAAATLYGASLVARARGARGAGRSLSLAGYVMTCAAAYVGGDLVYRGRIGVDHAPSVDDRWQPPREWTDVAAESRLAGGRPYRVDVAGEPVMLVRRDGRICALADTCSHLGGPLSDGKLDGDTVVCPWHGSRFSLEDGRVIDGPATRPQPCLEARGRDGRIEVRVAPGPGEAVALRERLG
jgi:nitrite reductase/ring-hydroxylating ferredoxin subunit/uncharacterized membrane protein